MYMFTYFFIYIINSLYCIYDYTLYWQILLDTFTRRGAFENSQQ